MKHNNMYDTYFLSRILKSQVISYNRDKNNDNNNEITKIKYFFETVSKF